MGVCKWKKGHIAVLENIQTKIMKALLNMPIRTANAYIKGEVGYSSHLYRDMKLKLTMLHHALQNTNRLRNIIIREWQLTSNGNNWIKVCKVYLKDIGINLDQLEEIERKVLEKKIKQIEKKAWKEELNSKSSLQYYKQVKKDIKEERMWKNSQDETVIRLFQSGSILTKDKVGKSDNEKKCSICHETETLYHLVKSCNKFENLRLNYDIKMEDNMEDILQLNNNDAKFKDYLMDLYQKRFLE